MNKSAAATVATEAGLIPVIFSQPTFGKGGRSRVGTIRLGHYATDLTDGRTLCGIRMDAPALENIRQMAFERSVECSGCHLRALRATPAR